MVRILPVAVTGEGSHEFASPLLGQNGGADLVRDVPGILGVKNIFHGQQQVVCSPRAVYMVVDGDEADLQSGKHPLQIAAHLDVVSAKPGEVLHQHTVDPSRLDVRLHAAEGGTIEVGAGAAIVLIEIYQPQLRVVLQILCQEFPLIYDAVALRLVAVLSGQAEISCRVPDFRMHSVSFLGALRRICQRWWARIRARRSSAGVLSPEKLRTMGLRSCCGLS